MTDKKTKTRKALKIPLQPGVDAIKFNNYQAPGYAIFIILGLTALVYSLALYNGITFIDDDMYLIKNPYIREFSLKGIQDIFTSFYEYNYHPLTTLSWLLEFRFFQLNPLPYHLDNVLLHLMNTWLVYKLALRLSKNDITGLAVAMLFAIHPMHVESVAWLSERKGLLCALFYFAALIQYVKFTYDGYRKQNYLLCLLFFALSLLSKSAAVTLPLAMVAIDWYRERKWTALLFIEKIPFLLLSVLFGILAIKSQNAGGAIIDLVGTYGPANRVLLVLSGIAFYILKAIVPFHLSAIHYYPNIDTGVLPWPFYASVPFLALMVWLIIRPSFFKKNILFGVAFFIASISVMLQLIPVGTAYAAERYSYISYFGLFYIAGQWLASITDNRKPIAKAAFAVVAVVFCLLSWKRIEVWKDTNTILADIAAKNEDNTNNYLVHYHWADYYKWDGSLREAIAEYNKTLNIKPDYANAYIKRGEIHDMMGDIVAAIMDYNQALALDPTSAMAYHNKGWAYFEMGDMVLAKAYLDTSISLDGKLSSAYNNRGWVSLKSGDTLSAAADFDSAIAISPDFARPYFNRALIKMNQGKIKEAILDYDKLISRYPDNSQAIYNRGLSYLKLKDTASSITDMKKASELGYKDADDVLKEIVK